MQSTLLRGCVRKPLFALAAIYNTETITLIKNGVVLIFAPEIVINSGMHKVITAVLKSLCFWFYIYFFSLQD